MSSKLFINAQGPRRDLKASRVSSRKTWSTGIVLALLTLVLLSIPSAQALGSLGVPLPSGTPENNALPQSGAPAPAPVPAVVQAAAADATGTLTNATQKAPALAAPASAATAQAPTVPPSKDTTSPASPAPQNKDEPVAQVLELTTQTVRTVATPLLTAAAVPLPTAVTTVATLLTAVAAATLLTAAVTPLLQPTAKAIATTGASILKTAAPVLGTTTNSLGKAAALLPETTTHARGTTAIPVLGTTAPHALDKKVLSALTTVLPTLGDPPAAPTLRALGTRVPVLVGAARRPQDNKEAAIFSPSERSASEASTSDASTHSAASTTASLASSPLMQQAGEPGADPFFASSPCPASTGLANKELLREEGCELGPAPGRLATFAFAQQLLRAGFAAEFSSALSASDVPGDGHRGGATSSGNTLMPPAPVPGPLPGGSTGAMASGAGVFFSIFITLAGLLLIGSLAAMRLLRLASEPWRPAPLVLIPERPG